MDTVIRSRGARAVTLTVVAAAAVAACGSNASPAPASGALAAGTWGGENAGVIVGDTTVHVHVGCTYGDFPAPVALDRDGRFDVAGRYVLRAFPVAVGPPLPARFVGSVDGALLTIRVAVTDTVERRTVTLGPVAVTRGREPRMGPCPICRRPDE